MEQQAEQELDPLTDEALKDFLEQSPVYAKRTYRQPDRRRQSVRLFEIEGWCDHCEKQKQLQLMGGREPLAPNARLTSQDMQLAYYCVTCGEHCRDIYCVAEVIGTDITLQKYGEWPRQRMRSNKVLEKFFEDDLETYRKGAACLEHGFGVGAFAYFRQIVEGHIQQLLNLLQVEAEATGQSDIVAALAELRKESPMKQRIELANNALPPHLKPHGLNPLGRIYAVLSDGVHGGTDEECLKKAEMISECLSFIVGELATSKRSREAFKRKVGSL